MQASDYSLETIIVAAHAPSHVFELASRVVEGFGGLPSPPPVVPDNRRRHAQ